MKKSQAPGKKTPPMAESGDPMREDERPDDERPVGSWADEASKARTAGDPRARAPKDEAGQPSTRSFDE